MGYADKEKQRTYQREYWKTYRSPKANARRRKSAAVVNDFDKYEYRVVPKNWRRLVPESAIRDKYTLPEVTSPLIKDLLAGKTVFVDYTPDETRSFYHPFRTLYSFFRQRGLRLRIHVFDNPDTDEFRKLLMWAEKASKESIAA